MKRIFLILFATIVSTQFVSAQKTVAIDIAATEARATDAITTIHASPLICDVELKKYQVGATWCRETEDNVFDKSCGRFTDYWYITTSDLIALIGQTEYFNDNAKTQIRNFGINQSQQYHQCDVIIAPLFNFRTLKKDDKKYGSAQFVITISGYAADYTNFRLATKDDIDLMIKNSQINNVANLRNVDAASKNKQ